MSIFAYILVACSWLVHPIYVSVTNMDIDAEHGTVIASVKIFTEDLETMLHNKYNIDGWIGTSHEHPKSRSLIAEYLADRFTMEANGQRIQFIPDSMVIHEDALWIYISIHLQQPVKSMRIRNAILTDFFSAQTNLMIINTGRKEKGYKLDRKKDIVEVELL